MSGFAEDPQAPCGRPASKKAFLHWVQWQREKFEFKNGEAVMHPGGSKRHAWIIGDFVRTLGQQLDPKIWTVAPTEIAVEISEDIRYPDVVVERRTGEGREVSTETPVLLVEVLSPSSVAKDLNAKLAEYTSLASLEAYIVASQDEAILWVWTRDPATRAFSKLPVEISGPGQIVELRSLGVELPLDEVFRSII